MNQFKFHVGDVYVVVFEITFYADREHVAKSGEFLYVASYEDNVVKFISAHAGVLLEGYTMNEQHMYFWHTRLKPLT